MSKPFRATLLAALLATLLVPGQGRAAEITDVADAADGDDPFDFDFEIMLDRVLKQGKIRRENVQGGEIVDVTELQYRELDTSLVLTGRAGLYKDLEIHLSIPIVLENSQNWRVAEDENGQPLVGLPQNSTLHNQSGICPNGDVDPSCIVQDFDFENGFNSFRGGLGDGSVGILYGLTNDQRDKYSATWVIGFDWTFPSGRSRSPFQVSGSDRDTRPVGLKTNFFTFRSALSKNLTFVDPFVEFKYTVGSARNNAFHNCDDAAGHPMQDMDTATTGVQNTCSFGAEWIKDGNNRGGSRPPHVGGVHFGAEFLPYVDPARFLRVAIELSFGAIYVSEGRYLSSAGHRFKATNELSDALGRQLYSEEYVRFDATLGFRVQASRYAKFHILATYGHETQHMITGETIGVDLDGTGKVELSRGELVLDEQNPNYDYRWDQPGRRFRMTETTLFGLQFIGELNF